MTDTPNVKITVKKRQMDIFTIPESISTAKEHTPFKLAIIFIFNHVVLC